MTREGVMRNIVQLASGFASNCQIYLYKGRKMKKTFTFYADGYGWSYDENEEAFINFGYAVINGQVVYGHLVHGDNNYFQAEHSSSITMLDETEPEVVDVDYICYSPFFI